ncbi:MAG: tRNA lysidine(34) synthetase TilS [Sphingomonadaceae bacterium]
MAISPDPALVSCFRSSLAGLWPCGGRLGIAVSGGPDSLALLLLAHTAMPRQVEAATVDHGLRKESAEEADFVARICVGLNIPHQILPVELNAGNIQHQARLARYDALAGWIRSRGIDALATAHHADDQAETLLMRLNRASGVAGLAGVRPKSNIPGHDIPLIRPLLGWRRATLAAVVHDSGIQAVHDPSNENLQYDRVKIRQNLAQSAWLDVASLAQSAGHLADAENALEWAAEREWQEAVSTVDAGYLYRPHAQTPRAIRLKVLMRAVLMLGKVPRGSALAALEAELSAGRGGNIAGVLISAQPTGWFIRPEPPRSG